MIVKDKTQSLIIYEKGMFTRYLLEICYLYLQACIRISLFIMAVVRVS